MHSSIIKISLALLPFLPVSQAHPPSWLSHSNKLGRLLVVPPKGHHHGPNSSICTEENMAVHREWSALSAPEKLDYTDSVQCLMLKPSVIPPGLAPGAISHYDDFVATHINKTLLVHNNGIFISWHRHFLYLFEKALKDECGFKGTLPYWNWPWWAEDLINSPIFDGSETSLGGDGAFNASRDVPRFGNITFPTGNGGGCVASGPFKDATVNFRNFAPTDMFRTENPPGALDHAPHCLRRDLNSPMAYNNTNQQIVDTLLAKPNIAAFQHYLSDPVPGTTSLAPHSGGHWAVGQDMHDVFVSPSDPVFWLHHGMVDLLWSRWQAKDPKNRQYALDGTITSFNNPPSVNATLDFVQDWGYLGKPMKIRELMDVTKGLYCYRYEYTEGALKPEGF